MATGPAAPARRTADRAYDRAMSLGARLKRLLGRDRAQGDPLADLDSSYRLQADLLQQSRRGVADVVTARKRVEVQLRGLEQSARVLHEQAQAAVAAGREDEARALLTRRAGVLEQAHALQPDLGRLAEQEARLQQQVQHLEARVEAFRVQKEALRAGHSAAEAHLRIGEAHAGISQDSADVGLALERARAQTEQLQARADAVEQLGAASAAGLPWESAGDRAQREIAELQAADGGVEAELARLRARRLDGPEAEAAQ